MSTLRFGTSAKRIENNVKLNIFEEKNVENMKKLLEEYELKIRELEVEKMKDKSRNEACQLAIKRLFEQKKNLAERLLCSGEKDERNYEQGNRNYENIY